MSGAGMGQGPADLLHSWGVCWPVPDVGWDGGPLHPTGHGREMRDATQGQQQDFHSPASSSEDQSFGSLLLDCTLTFSTLKGHLRTNINLMKFWSYVPIYVPKTYWHNTASGPPHQEWRRPHQVLLQIGSFVIHLIVYIHLSLCALGLHLPQLPTPEGPELGCTHLYSAEPNKLVHAYFEEMNFPTPVISVKSGMIWSYYPQT